MAAPSYCTVGSNKLEDAKGFYDALLTVVGMGPMFDHPSGGRLYRGNDGVGMFGVLAPRDGNAATIGNGSMVGFAMDSREQVDAFHSKALELGGTCEGPPGERGPGAYFAYCRDLDGNKLCAFKWG